MSISGIGSNSYSYYSTTANTASNTTNASPFANLNLTQSQKTSISNIFSQLQSGTITQTQAQSEINAVLTPAQQSQLQQDLQQLQSHRHHHHHQDANSTSSAADDAFGIPTTTTSGSSTGSIGDLALAYWAQSQTNGNS